MKPGDHFECTSIGTAESFQAVGFWRLLIKVLPYALLWGLGTAIGELPPYAASYAASKAHASDADFEDLALELSSDSKDLMSLFRRRMIQMIERRGALSVFLLSCWPNALFDLCGIVCGHYMMPFWSFFLALCFGKGVIKVAIQTGFFVFLFSKQFDKARAHLIGVIGEMPPLSFYINRRFGDASKFEQVIYEKLVQFRRDGLLSMRGDSKGGGGSMMSMFINIFIVLLISYFVCSAISQFAQMRQREIDEEEILCLERSLRETSEVKGD